MTAAPVRSESAFHAAFPASRQPQSAGCGDQSVLGSSIVGGLALTIIPAAFGTAWMIRDR